MIRSMTGFGRAMTQCNDKTITVEIKSLNSKSTDLKIRLPQRYREKEMAIRNIIMPLLVRGKIEVAIDVISTEGAGDYSINTTLFKHYYKDLVQLQNELGIPQADFISSILRIQGVIDVPKNGIEEEEWNALSSAVHKAALALMEFRQQEGVAMENDLRLRVEHIEQHLKSIEPFEPMRTQKMKQKLLQTLEEQLGTEKVDKNRLEQELIYYLEKFDINEEKVRLHQHCKYFLEQLRAEKIPKGRKLAFIGQEMGREINTIGSKANSANIQHYVVMMKDELEKIKEQAANIL